MDIELPEGWATIVRRPDKRRYGMSRGSTGQIAAWEVPEQSIGVSKRLGTVLPVSANYEFARISVAFSGRILSLDMLDGVHAYMRSVVANALMCETSKITGDEHVDALLGDPPCMIFCRQISVNYGLTLKKEDDRRHGKSDVSMSYPVADGDSIESAVAIIREWLTARMVIESETLRSGSISMGF